MSEAENRVISPDDRPDDFAPFGGGAGSAPAPAADAVGEARNALVALGYKPQEASRMARAVAEAGMETEEIIRRALKATVKE